MMVGGPEEAVTRLTPILDVLAPPTSEESQDAIGAAAGPTSATPAPGTT